MLLFFVILFLYVGTLRATFKFVCFDVFTQHAASLLFAICVNRYIIPKNNPYICSL